MLFTDADKGCETFSSSRIFSANVSEKFEFEGCEISRKFQKYVIFNVINFFKNSLKCALIN